MKGFSTLVFFFISLSMLAQQQQSLDLTPNKLAEQLLTKTKRNEDTNAEKKALAELSLSTLTTTLKTDTHKKAFWINVYNAFIIDVLRKNPKSYNDRGDFFSEPRIPIAGELLSFDKIEHGILRRSQSKIGFGYLGKVFTDKTERSLRVAKLDYRIHFALNCGAKDCPPVTVYTVDQLDAQLNANTKYFLESSTQYNPTTNTAVVTTLFSWFRGDFGGTNGIKTILFNNGVIPTKEVDLDYDDYDWTIDLQNFSESTTN